MDVREQCVASAIRREIVLPETKPETEWLRGRAVRKMSPRWDHARLQAWWLRELSAWAADRGYVLPEWRFRITPPGEATRPLIPDVAYLAYDRLGDADESTVQTPLVPPNVVVEIRSPGDRRADVEDKAATFVRAGAELVILVNPRTRTVIAIDATERRIFSGGDSFVHATLPGFTFALSVMFDELRLRRG